jgi:hypothetical protein
MKYVDPALQFLDGVVNQDRAMHQFAYVRTFANDAAHARKSKWSSKGVPEARCHLGIILGDAGDDLSEIVQGSLREEELVVHWGKRLRTSVAGTVRPCVASSRPSSMAARVSSSSSSKTGLGLSMSNFFALAMAHDSPGPLTDAK